MEKEIMAQSAIGEVDRVLEENYGITYSELVDMAPSMETARRGVTPEQFAQEFAKTYSLVPLNNVGDSAAADINLRIAAINAFAANRDGWNLDDQGGAWVATDEGFLFNVKVDPTGQLFSMDEYCGSLPEEIKLDGLGRVAASDVIANCGTGVHVCDDIDIKDLLQNELRTHLHRERAVERELDVSSSYKG